jgi:hypothetical protein
LISILNDKYIVTLIHVTNYFDSMEIVLVYFFLFVCLALSAWDIFTGIVGIAAEMSKIAYSPDIVQLFRDLIYQKPAYVVLGIFFALIVVMSDYLFVKVYEIKEAEKAEKARLAAEEKANKTKNPKIVGTPIDYIKINKTSIYFGLFFWTIFKAIDFQTTVVGTAQLLGVQLQENANIVVVWQTVSGNSWTQMAILIAASLMITGGHLGVGVFVKLIEFLSKPKSTRKP